MEATLMTPGDIVRGKVLVIKEFRNTFKLEESVISDILVVYEEEISESVSLGNNPVSIAMEYQARWASR